MVADVKQVTVSNMQEYLNLDSDMDAEILQDLIDMAQEDIRNAVDLNIPLEFYQQYPVFNQAVRTMVDFTYYNRGELGEQKIGYPPSYQYMVNGIRWRVRREYANENSNSQAQS